MVAFSWSTWREVISQSFLSPQPRRRRPQACNVEPLEYRLVLAAPVANAASFSTAINTPLTATLTGSDADGDPLIFHTVTTGDGGILSLNSFNGEFTFTPFENFQGVYTFTFNVNDGTEDSPAATVTITVGNGQSNTAPVANSAAFSTTIDTPLNGTLSGSDADGDPLTFATVTDVSHGTLTVNANGSFTYTPNSGFTGNDSFTFRANDGIADSASATIAISVNAPNTTPVANAASFTTPIDTTLNGMLTGSDADDDFLTFESVTGVSHGTLTVNSNGTFVYSPATGFTGSDSFTFKVNDGTTDSPPATVNITVTSVINTTPVANSATFSTAVNTAMTATLTGSDADNDSLVFHTVTSTSHGALSLNSFSGEFTYTPFAGFTGIDSFTFNVNDGIADSPAATVTIHIGTTNTAPVANSATITTQLDTAFSGTLTGSDADGDVLTFAAGPLSPRHGFVTIDSDGSFIYQPFAGFGGDDSFSFVVSDGIATSAPATVTVHVGIPSNTAPVASPLTIDVSENTSFNGILTATDADSDPLTFRAGAASPDHGTVIINSNGSFVYTPDTGFSGNDFFSFVANDGTVDSADALVTVHVAGTNTAPLAFPQTFTVSANTTLNGALTGTDADGNSLIFAAGTVSALHGTATINSNGSFSYVPVSGFSGDDAFSFKVNDGTTDSTEAVVIIHVNAVTNSAPTVINGTGSAMAGVAFNGSLSALATDLDGDALLFTAITQPTNGVLALSPDGTFVYTPDLGFVGNDSFTFRANDGLLNSNVATFTISVTSTSELFTLNLSSEPGTIATSMGSIVPLDPTASLINVDPAASFANATIGVAITAGGDSHDRIVVTDGSSSAGSIDVRGRRILFNGAEVARLSGGRRGQALRVTFNASATKNAINAVLQRIGLRTTKNASPDTRTVLVQVNAGDSSSSATIDADVA